MHFSTTFPKIDAFFLLWGSSFPISMDYVHADLAWKHKFQIHSNAVASVVLVEEFIHITKADFNYYSFFSFIENCMDISLMWILFSVWG